MDTPLRCTARPDPGGSTRGVSAERFETPLVGGAAWFWRRGGNPPAPACPRRGKRERGGIQIPCCRRRLPPGLPPEVALRRSLPKVFTATRKPEFPKKKDFLPRPPFQNCTGPPVGPPTFDKILIQKPLCKG